MKGAYLIAGIALVLSVVGVVLGLAGRQSPSGEPVGATPGGDFTNFVDFQAGNKWSGIVATTSQGSVTVTAAEFRRWASSGVVSYAPGLVGATTVTLPASSTISDLVPKAGDRQTFCVRNATSTAGTTVILAGGTGVNLTVASSSTTILGSTKLITGKVGCITLVRQAATATTFDIDALLTVYQ